MKRYLRDIQEKTKDMTPAARREYILTYYWYHILGICAAFALLLFLVVHVTFGMQHPLFTCVIVNQEVDHFRDEALAEAFAVYSGMDARRINVDSDFNFSYGEIRLEGVNESSYEKFFFKWRNQELDAVIMPESFYKFCKEMDGEFWELSSDGGADCLRAKGLPLYEDKGQYMGVRIEDTHFTDEWNIENREQYLLVFPKEGVHRDNCELFLDYIREIQ